MASLLHKPGGFQWPPCYTNQVVFNGLPVTQTRWFPMASLLHKPGGFQRPPSYTNQVVFNGLPLTQTRWFSIAPLLHKPGGFQRPPSYTYQVIFIGPPVTHPQEKRNKLRTDATGMGSIKSTHYLPLPPPPRKKRMKKTDAPSKQFQISTHKPQSDAMPHAPTHSPQKGTVTTSFKYLCPKSNQNTD